MLLFVFLPCKLYILTAHGVRNNHFAILLNFGKPLEMVGAQWVNVTFFVIHRLHTYTCILCDHKPLMLIALKGLHSPRVFFCLLPPASFNTVMKRNFCICFYRKGKVSNIWAFLTCESGVINKMFGHGKS